MLGETFRNALKKRKRLNFAMNAFLSTVLGINPITLPQTVEFSSLAEVCIPGVLFSYPIALRIKIKRANNGRLHCSSNDIDENNYNI